MVAPQSVPCPKCGRALFPDGVLEVGGVSVPLFQCDDCLVEREFCGSMIKSLLTFVLDPDGRPYDPTAPGDGYTL